MISDTPRIGATEIIIWLNGAFGVGKTTTAWSVISLSRIFDPEEVGYMLAHVMVHEPVNDFQARVPTGA